MSALQEFLNAHPVDNITEKLAISKRFKDSAGNLHKFTIKAMTNDEFEDFRKRSTTMKKGGKVEMDIRQFNNAIVINNTLEPSFKDAESIKKLGCMTPEEYLNKVLLAGEIAELSAQIQRISGFDRNMDDLVEEAKN